MKKWFVFAVLDHDLPFFYATRKKYKKMSCDCKKIGVYYNKGIN
jgi:hypothetical protein